MWLAPLDEVRPVVVLTRDPIRAVLHGVIGAPGHLHHRGRLDGSRLVRRVGRARATTMLSICRALAIAVGCDR